MKTFCYGVAVIVLWVSGLSHAVGLTHTEYKERYDLQKIVAYRETNERPSAKLGDTIYSSSDEGYIGRHLTKIGISSKNDSCFAEIDNVDSFQYGKTYGLTITQAGSDALNRLLRKEVGIDLHDITYEFSRRTLSPQNQVDNKGYCKFITYAFLYATKARDIVMLDDNYVYFFKRHPEISYTVTPLPITESAISCMDEKRCDKRLVQYENSPMKFEEPTVNFFYRLPSIDDIEVYLGWWLVETDDEFGTIVYLITIKGNKLNYARIGSGIGKFTDNGVQKYTKFLINKDYSVIEGIDLQGKPAKFAIKSNGVIIKKP